MPSIEKRVPSSVWRTAPFITAEQIHGDGIGIVDEALDAECLDACDGLITNQPGVCLGIYVADCCAVYLLDPVRRAIGLVHSGRKGTELGIVGQAIDLMRGAIRLQAAGSGRAAEPLHSAAAFRNRFCSRHRARPAATVALFNVHDTGVCTACELERYYSYRAEKGKTGRMLALLAMTATGSEN